MLTTLKKDIHTAIAGLYDHRIDDGQLLISPTKKEFEGEYTFVVFPLVKAIKKKPEEIGQELGERIQAESNLVTGYNVVKGFLNLSLSKRYWLQTLSELTVKCGQAPIQNGKTLMVEFCSPNTNKPIHLGHIRNILLGWSMAQIGEANGYKVVKTQVVNDRGIAVCKSMLSWKESADGATPESQGIKGDHFVGKYYVAFEQLFQSEYKAWQSTEKGQAIYKSLSKDGDLEETFFKSYKNKYFNEHSKIGKRTKDMLLQWEAGDPETLALWKQLNDWVYEGFDKTFDALGIDFDVVNYESETYILGKEFVQQGLQDKIFYQKEDSSVWVDLEDAKMDQKLVLRSDGTAVYVTQDLGTAHMRYAKYKMDKLVYVVADEQDYHFKVLFEILKRLGEPYADNLYHLSYGMVDLPTGKMKSREGTVVDADELIEEVISEARNASQERGGLEGLTDAERTDVFRKIGMAALKYFIIKVNPKKRMTFDPKESVDMQGQTGPYIQNAYVRIRSILRRVSERPDYDLNNYKQELQEIEKELIVLLTSYEAMLGEAMNKYDPSLVANYCYALAKAYHRFYHDCRILNAEQEETRGFRLALSELVAERLSAAMKLLGIEMPEYM